MKNTIVELAIVISWFSSLSGFTSGWSRSSKISLTTCFGIAHFSRWAFLKSVFGMYPLSPDQERGFFYFKPLEAWLHSCIFLLKLSLDINPNPMMRPITTILAILSLFELLPAQETYFIQMLILFNCVPLQQAKP